MRFFSKCGWCGEAVTIKVIAGSDAFVPETNRTLLEATLNAYCADNSGGNSCGLDDMVFVNNQSRCAIRLAGNSLNITADMAIEGDMDSGTALDATLSSDNSCWVYRVC